MTDAIERFGQLAALPEDELDLARGALVIAAGADPGIDEDWWLGELEVLADGVSGLDDLLHRLFVELRFSGNRDDYYEVENSLLHRVIERRLGIPISLSLVLIEVARRADIVLEGVGMPGHFLVRDPASGRYIDAFSFGQALTLADCEGLFRAATGAGPEIEFGEHLLPAASKHDILARVLANLKGIYASAGAATELEWVMRMRLSLPIVPVTEVVDLGQALAMQGRFLEAAREIEAAAEANEESSAQLASAARSFRARLN